MCDEKLNKFRNKLRAGPFIGGAGTTLSRFGGVGTALYRPMSPKIFVKISPFKLKNCQEPYFCMRNPKKLVPRRSVDPPDSNMGGFYRY